MDNIAKYACEYVLVCMNRHALICTCIVPFEVSDGSKSQVALHKCNNNNKCICASVSAIHCPLFYMNITAFLIIQNPKYALLGPARQKMKDENKNRGDHK